MPLRACVCAQPAWCPWRAGWGAPVTRELAGRPEGLPRCWSPERGVRPGGLGGPLPSEQHVKALFGGRCLLGESGRVSWVGLWSLPSLSGGEEGDGRKTRLTLPGPGGGHSPGGGLGLGPWAGGPRAAVKFSKSSAIKTLLPVFAGSRLGRLRLARCAFSAVATWGARNSGGGEEVQTSLVPRLFPRVVTLITDQFHPLLKNKLL